MNDGTRLRCLPVCPPGSSSTTCPVSAAGTATGMLLITPVEPTRLRLFTPFGSAGFASCACAGGRPGATPYCACAPPITTNSPTPTATIVFRLIDALPGLRETVT